MNEKMKEFANKMCGGEFLTNHSWTVDELIRRFDCSIDNEGEIIDENGNETGFWYEDLI